MGGGFRHVEVKKGGDSAVDLSRGLEWDGAERLHDGCPDGSREHRGNAVPDLAESVPFRPMEAEPIGIGMDARRLADRDDPRPFGMDGSWRSESSARTVRPRTKRVRLSIPGEFEETAFRLRFALRRGREPFFAFVCVEGPEAVRENVGIETSDAGEIGRIDRKTTQPRGVMP